MESIKLDPVWDSKADQYSLGTYYDWYKNYGVCTVLRAGHVAGYYKKIGPSAGMAKVKMQRQKPMT